MRIWVPISAQLLYWYVEFGITIAIVIIFHFHTYWKSSKTMIVKEGQNHEKLVN